MRMGWLRVEIAIRRQTYHAGAHGVGVAGSRSVPLWRTVSLNGTRPSLFRANTWF